jgi:hypothetical protein
VTDRYREYCETCEAVIDQAGVERALDEGDERGEAVTRWHCSPICRSVPDRLRWVVALDVGRAWVADGYDPDDEDIADMLGARLPYAYGHELGGTVITRPPQPWIDLLQGRLRGERPAPPVPVTAAGRSTLLDEVEAEYARARDSFSADKRAGFDLAVALVREATRLETDQRAGNVGAKGKG